jgi:hypothetical protein
MTTKRLKSTAPTTRVAVPALGSKVNRMCLLLLVLIPVMALPGCISRSTYNRDMSKLLNKIKLDKQESEGIYDKLEAQNVDRSITLNKLTTRYIQLQKNHSRLQSRFNHFDKDLNAFSHDIAELKLVISKNMDKIRSSMANEMLIKIIDMEFRIEELRKKEAEELPLLPLNENGQFDPAPDTPATK